MKVLTPKSGINQQPPANPEKSSATQPVSPKLNNGFMNAILMANSGIEAETKTEGSAELPSATEENKQQEQQASVEAFNPNAVLPPNPMLNPIDLSKLNVSGDANQIAEQTAQKTEFKSDTNPVLKPNLPTKTNLKLPLPATSATVDTEKLAEKLIKTQIHPEHVSNTQHHLASSASTVSDLLSQSAGKTTNTVDSINLQAPDLQNALQNPALQNNKYTTALTQLGNFINSHTAMHAPNETAEVNTAAASYSDGLKKMSLPEYEAKIELSPQTLDALNKDTYKANIKIYPPELGHVEAKLRISKDNAELIILTENNVVKEVVESNLAQLRENFQRADINLTSIQVQTQPPQTGGKEQNSQNQQDSSGFTSAENPSDMNPQKISPEKPRTINSIIDTYA